MKFKRLVLYKTCQALDESMHTFFYSQENFQPNQANFLILHLLCSHGVSFRWEFNLTKEMSPILI